MPGHPLALCLRSHDNQRGVFVKQRYPLLHVFAILVLLVTSFPFPQVQAAPQGSIKPSEALAAQVQTHDTQPAHRATTNVPSEAAASVQSISVTSSHQHRANTSLVQQQVLTIHNDITSAAKSTALLAPEPPVMPSPSTITATTVPTQTTSDQDDDEWHDTKRSYWRLFSVADRTQIYLPLVVQSGDSALENTPAPPIDLLANCPISPGAGASSPLVAGAFLLTTSIPAVAAEIDCPSSEVTDLGGAPVQYFDNDSLIIYNAGTAYYIGPGYKTGYLNAGGPTGFLGFPTEHSTEASDPPAYYQDYSSNFTGMPIQDFEYGFVGRNFGSWEGARYYPLACYVQVVVIQVFEPGTATPEEPNPPDVEKKQITVVADGIADPGNPGSDSFNTAQIKISTSDGNIFKTMPPDGNGFLYTHNETFDPDEQLTFAVALQRASDGRVGYAPQAWIVDGTEFNIPLSYGAHTLSSCNSAPLPGGGGYDPPTDTTPPVIGDPFLEQDGRGNVNVRVQVTDNVAVADVTVNIDGTSYTMIPLGGDLYEVPIYGLSIGSHQFFIEASDTSGNTARKPESGFLFFTIERTDSQGEVPWQGYSPDPVNTFIGNFIYHYTDFTLHEPGPDLELNRFYNAQSSHVGLFGLGWSTLLDMRIREMDNTLFQGAILYFPDGRTINFPANGDGFDRAKTSFATLERDGSGYLLTKVDQTRYWFNDQGRLTQVADLNGNAINLVYNGDVLSEILTSSGRSIQLTSDTEGRITHVEGPEAISLDYSYDADGRLLTVTDGTGATVTYHYNTDNGLTRIETPEGNDFLAEQEFDDRGRVTFQRVGDAFINEFVYDDANRTTTLTDAYGNTIIYRYDEKGRLVEQINAHGHSEIWTYNNDNQVTSHTDHNGNTTSYEYNAQGDRIKETDPLGGVTTWDYDAQHNLLATTDALGRTTRYEYDAQGNRTAMIDALGGRTELRYNNRGQIIEQVSPRGFSTTYTYDNDGNLVSERDPLGGVTRHNYDAQGRRIQTTDANGHATTYTYDANRNLLRVTDALGGTTTYTYDANNNRLSETDANGNTTNYTYSKLGKLLTTTASDGGVTSITYDDMGNRIARTNPLSHTTRWELDDTYRVISEMDALGAVKSYTYDANGNRVSATDANGNTTRYEYDALNRLITVIDPLGGVIRYTYDAAGNRLSETNPLGQTTRYEYDALNRLVRKIDAAGNITTYTYDADGNRISETNPLGQTTRYEYDALNRVISETDPLGRTSRRVYDGVGNTIEEINARGLPTRYEYDALNRKVGTIDADGNITRYRYDAVGNRIEMMDAAGNVTRYAYDTVNRQIQAVDALGGRTIVEYDLAGQQVGVTDEHGHTTRFVYDAVGRRIAIIDPLGFTERYAYDAAGHQIARTDKNGHTTHTEYDELNRIAAQTDANGATTRFRYDAAGNQTARLDANGEITTYAYDILNRRVEEINALGQITRTEYDALGRAIRTLFADGTSTARTYDAAGQMVAELDAEGFVTRYGYDLVGNQTVITDALGFATSFTYDVLNRQIEVRDDMGLIKQTSYDTLGNVISETDGNGHTTRYEHDALSRLTSITDAGGHETRLSYDAADNRIAVKDANGHTTQYTYDEANQVIAQTDANGHTTRYEYDAVGQRIYTIDAAGIVTKHTYDPVGQLVAVTLNYRPWVAPNEQTNVTTTYTYDAVGNRTSITDPNGNTVAFTPDAVGQLIAETDALGNTTRYTYDTVGRQVQIDHPDGAVTRSSYDRNGRLIRTTYDDGSRVIRTYDAVGRLLLLTDQSGVTRHTYDDRGRLVEVHTPRGQISYAYDQADNRTSITYADGRTVAYDYLPNNQLKRVTHPDGQVTTYERDGVGQVIRQDNGNNTETQYAYDPANNLLSVETTQNGQPLSGVAYTYNAINQRTQATFTYHTEGTSITETYEQDALRRLTARSTSAGVQTSYTYDAAGNRIDWESNDDPRTPQPFDAMDLAFRYDSANQLEQVTNAVDSTQIKYRYDANGNRIEERSGDEGRTFTYDDAQRLVSVEVFQTDGGTRSEQEIAAMLYDGIGRRVAIAEALGSGSSLQTTEYLYDGLEPIATYETWHSSYTNLYRAEGGRILAQEHITGGGASQSAWYTQDGLGNTLTVAEEQDSRSYRYEPYGIRAETYGTGSVGTDFTFGGQEYDESTGLYHYHARDYDPFTATWLTRDPYRGTASDPQTLHRYGYVQGNPVNLWDAYGYVAQSGTYGKGQSEPNPLIELLFGAQLGLEFEWDWEIPQNLLELPDDWSLPDSLRGPVNGVKSPIRAGIAGGFSLTRGHQAKAVLTDTGVTAGIEVCRSFNPYVKGYFEADLLSRDVGVLSVAAGIGLELGIKGEVKACLQASADVAIDALVPELAVGYTLHGNAIIFGQVRPYVTIEANALVAKASGEAGIKLDIEYPLAECVIGSWGANMPSSGCNVSQTTDIKFALGVYAKVEASGVLVRGGNYAVEEYKPIGAFYVQAPTLMGWIAKIAPHLLV
jgi:RHS repeat-associated protein